jgi:hypothetical protein
MTTCLVGKLTVGRVKWQVGQDGVTLSAGGFSGVLIGRVRVAGRVGRPNADLCDLAWERVS